jgi:hypothetical protein
VDKNHGIMPSLLSYLNQYKKGGIKDENSLPHNTVVIWRKTNRNFPSLQNVLIDSKTPNAPILKV